MTNSTKRSAELHKNILFQISPEAHRALVRAKADDGISIADRLRALIELWLTDPPTVKKAAKVAKKNKIDQYTRNLTR